MSAPRIDDATAADIDRLLELEAVCFPEDPWTRGMLQEELSRSGGLFFVARDEDRIVGFAIGWFILGELHVLQVAVSPGARRRGLGRLLMAHLEEGARGGETAWLEVRIENAAAIGLYEALGYRAIARRPRYYEDGCDAVVMRRSLNG